MFKKILPVLISLLIALPAFTQSLTKETVKESVKEVLQESKADEMISLKGKFGITAQTGFFLFSDADLMQMVLVGFEYHISNQISIRPSFGFSIGNPESKNKMTGASSKDDNKILAGTLALLYHFYTPGQKLIPYFGIQGEYIHYDQIDRNSGGTSEGREKTDYINGFIKIGAKYMLSSQFGFFGDFAVGFSYYKNNDKTVQLSNYSVTSETERTDFMIVSKKAFLGAVFYF